LRFLLRWWSKKLYANSQKNLYSIFESALVFLQISFIDDFTNHATE